MLQPTIVTWIIIAFGAITVAPLLAAQLIMIIQPNGKKAKELIIGKDEDWRDKTHFKSAYALAWADWIFFFPAFKSNVLVNKSQEKIPGKCFQPLIVFFDLKIKRNHFIVFMENNIEKPLQKSAFSCFSPGKKCRAFSDSYLDFINPV